MPQQLIYTSSPRGLVAGRSGYCTVARSASMREALMLQLEKLSYYQHLSLSGGHDRPIFTCRVVDIRGSRFHVLSRLQDAGLDFTGRTNFIAHHLVFSPEEIRQHASPPVILRDWPGWVTAWPHEPQMLASEDWSALAALSPRTYVPAQTWQRVAGDAIHGYALLEARVGASFRLENLANEDVLKLFAESLELLEVRDPRRDSQASAWNYTFTTSLQEQDNPADFRWRCFPADHPAANRFATPDCRTLAALRAAKMTTEETAFARAGRQPPRFINEPQDLQIHEGEAAHFSVQAEGIPSPAYQWFAVDRANNGQVLPGETRAELIIPTPPLGVSRYIVSATNSLGTAQSEVATLSVERKIKLTASVGNGIAAPAKPSLYNVKTAEDIERDRERHRLRNEAEARLSKQRRNKIFLIASLVILAVGVGTFVLVKQISRHHAVQAAIPNQKQNPPAPAGSSPATQAKSSTDASVPPTNNPAKISAGVTNTVPSGMASNVPSQKTKPIEAKKSDPFAEPKYPTNSPSTNSNPGMTK